MISEYGYTHNPKVPLIREYDYYHSHLRAMDFRLENMGITIIQG